MMFLTTHVYINKTLTIMTLKRTRMPRRQQLGILPMGKTFSIDKIRQLFAHWHPLLHS